jgi:hypothetical protein
MSHINMSFNIIIIANIAEAFEGIINKVQLVDQRVDRIGIEHGLCDRTFLWEGDDKVVVTPFPIAETLFKKNMEVFSFKNVINLSPKNINVSLSDAIREDGELLDNLIDIIKNNPGIKISPYCITRKFLSFIDFLEKENLNFSVEEIPACKNPYWLASYLDSKVGSRMEIGSMKHASVFVPKSVLCQTKQQVMDAVTWFYDKDKSCAIKANFGESSWGTLLLSKKKFGNVEDLILFVRDEFKKDAIWRSELTLVEEYVESNGLYGTAPSAEIYINNGGPRITYICDQAFDSHGGFLGVSLGGHAINPLIGEKIKAASSCVGGRFFEMGYRGFFDIDFIVSENGEPFILETNMRRTGGTHVYDAVKRLFGDDWEKKVFALSRDNFVYGNERLSSEEMLGKMKNILYPINSQKRGAIISIISGKRPSIGFIIIGSSKEDAIGIYDEMVKCWEKKSKN